MIRRIVTGCVLFLLISGFVIETYYLSYTRKMGPLVKNHHKQDAQRSIKFVDAIDDETREYPTELRYLKHNTTEEPISVKIGEYTLGVTPGYILKRLAVGIKTFNRPHCVKRTIKSFKSYYPYLPIFVADDSYDDVLSAEPGIQYLRLPPETGVAYGRNSLVQHIHDAGYEYIIISDDDYTLDKTDDLIKMASYFIATGAHVLAPTRCDYGTCGRSKGAFLLDDGHLIMFPNITSYGNTVKMSTPTCVRTDIIQQFFIARTETLIRSGWDPYLKNNDHYDFLLNARSHQLKLVSCSDIHIIHNKIECQEESAHSKEYSETRKRRWYNLVPYVFKKWNLTRITDETGKQIWMNGEGVAEYKFAAARTLSRHDGRYSSFLSTILLRINSHRASWHWVRPRKRSRYTSIQYTKHHECLSRLTGELEVEYDRWKKYDNENFIIPFDILSYNDSCPMAERLWRVSRVGRVINKHVFYVVAVANDGDYLHRIVSQLASSKQDYVHSSVVIVDMSSLENRVSLSSLPSEGLNVHLLYLGAPFSRSIGLKTGIELVSQLAISKNRSNPIVFTVDTSMILPSNFSDILRRNVRCGITAYAPICYKVLSGSSSSGGYWVNAGYGMVGMCLKDYEQSGGFDPRWGFNWGAEDIDMINRLKTIAGLQYIIRPRLAGFHHLHSDVNKKMNTQYYQKKNVYDGPLPITPITTLVMDFDLILRLVEFAEKALEPGHTYTPFSVYKTIATDGALFDVHLIDENEGRHYVLIASPLV